MHPAPIHLVHHCSAAYTVLLFVHTLISPASFTRAAHSNPKSSFALHLSPLPFAIAAPAIQFALPAKDCSPLHFELPVVKHHLIFSSLALFVHEDQ